MNILNKKAFSLIEIMLAVAIFAMGIVGLYYLFAQGYVEVAKAEYVAIATMIAKGEMDSVNNPKYNLIKSPYGNDWVKVDSSNKLYEQFEYPEDYLDDRFSKKVIVEEVIPKRLKKITISVKWEEIVKGETKTRQLNYPTFVANTRVYIYHGSGS